LIAREQKPIVERPTLLAGSCAFFTLISQSVTDCVLKPADRNPRHLYPSPLHQVDPVLLLRAARKPLFRR
jgi:hypothetical protein